MIGECVWRSTCLGLTVSCDEVVIGSKGGIPEAHEHKAGKEQAMSSMNPEAKQRLEGTNTSQFPLTQPGHATSEESDNSDPDEGMDGGGTSEASGTGGTRETKEKVKATNLVSPVAQAEVQHDDMQRKVESFDCVKVLFGEEEEGAEGTGVLPTQRADEGGGAGRAKNMSTNKMAEPKGRNAAMAFEAALSALRKSPPKKSKRSNSLPEKQSGAHAKEIDRGPSSGTLPAVGYTPAMRMKDFGLCQTMMAEDQMMAVLKDPEVGADPRAAMQDMGMVFAAFDSRRPPDWMKTVCAMNNRYYKLYLEGRFRTLDAVEGEMDKLVQSIAKTFQSGDAAFDGEDVACRMLALNQMLLMRSKRVEQEGDALCRSGRMVNEEEVLMALEAADITPQKVTDWRVNSAEFQPGESTDDEGPVCNKKPAAKRKTPKRVLLGSGPVRIDCSHWKNFKGADRVILGVGTMEYDRDGNVWYTRAKDG